MTASTSASAAGGAGHAAVTVTVRSSAEDEDAEKIDEKTGDGDRHQTIRVHFRRVCERWKNEEKGNALERLEIKFRL